MSSQQPSVACARCGRSRADASPVEAVSWSMERVADHVHWLCPGCVRRHLPDIESKLPLREW